jgi:hypothetical protein
MLILMVPCHGIKSSGARLLRSGDSRTLERTPVGLRAGADQPLEVVAEARWRAEPDLGGDALDGMSRGLEQALRTSDPGSTQPLHRGCGRLLSETPVQGAETHLCPGSEVVEGEFPVGVLFDPMQERLLVGAVRAGLLVHDVLGLPTVPLEGHHGQPGCIGCHRGTVIPTDHVQTEIWIPRAATLDSSNKLECGRRVLRTSGVRLSKKFGKLTVPSQVPSFRRWRYVIASDYLCKARKWDRRIAALGFRGVEGEVVRVHYDAGVDLPRQRRVYGAHKHRHQAHRGQGHVIHLPSFPGHGFEGLGNLLHAEVLRPADLDRLAPHVRIDDGQLDEARDVVR